MTVDESTHRSDADAMIGLLNLQLDHYRRLKDLSVRQAGLIEQGDTEQLLGVLGERQRVVDVLTRLNQQLAEYRESWPTVANDLAPQQRDRVASLLDEVDRLLQSIVAQDDKDQQKLQVAQQHVGVQISHVARTSAAVHAYRSGPQPGARFADHHG